MTPGEAAAWVKANIADWPTLRLHVALELLERYGLPQEHSRRHLAWYDNGPWRRTLLAREGAAHNFPRRHEDVLEQTINYRVPEDKVTELSAYNGSLVIDRTRGELTVHCDSEPANILTLNIADDIAKGARSAEQGRGYHAQVVRGVEIGEPESYPQKLRFQPASARDTADAGEVAPLLRHLGD